MFYSISNIYYCPIKSLSLSSINSCIVKKYKGIVNDRLFAFSRNLNIDDANIIEKEPNKRKLDNFITLKNSPFLNKYKFYYEKDLLSLFIADKKIISVSTLDHNYGNLICDKLTQLEVSLVKPIYLLKNINYPFFDTTHSNIVSNTLSLININSVKDFEKKTNSIIEHQRFRGNLYIDGIKAWDERNWINKIIKINKVSFKVEKNIARCSAINLKPNTDNVTINLPMHLRRHYGHIDMGIYLSPLEDGEINIGNQVSIN